MTIRFLPLALMLPLLACEAAPPERPMDEVPRQTTLADGSREYGFRNGCVIVIEPTRAVVRTEASDCQLHHRDIALLYASAD